MAKLTRSRYSCWNTDPRVLHGREGREEGRRKGREGEGRSGNGKPVMKSITNQGL